ncbi:unnamed protein product [marine sediment metagenome]|uniref:Uncharacterized protein n=1 Tax=marine sediment metagenome TaxID=412755 RepID=X0UBS6_9ZZZZ
MKKYYATDGGISTKEIVRETDSSVWTPSRWEGKGERREAKVSTYSAYFDTFDEAFAWVLKRANARLEKAERQVGYAKEQLKKVKGFRDNAEN